MSDSLSHSIASLGPWSVFVSSFVGPYLFPAAGELAIIAAVGVGVSPWEVVALGVAGAVASDQTAYGVGRVGGGPISRRMLVPSRRAHLEDRVHRHAVSALIPGRMLPGARTWLALLAGVAHLPHRRFSALNLAGCILWSAVFTLIGVVFGATADVEGIIDGIHRWSWPIAITVLALIAARVVYIHMQRGSSTNQ